uniref:Uncharacterized protein n=1 Tax=Kalanchoe fedtschenkoi TaxID=63787 RepID=A0A7N0TFM8_KALFE
MKDVVMERLDKGIMEKFAVIRNLVHVAMLFSWVAYLVEDYGFQIRSLINSLVFISRFSRLKGVSSRG